MDLLKQYLPLVFFKGNPLELPKSLDFLKYTLVFYYAVELFMQMNMIDDPFEAFTDVTFETILTLIFVFLTLWLNRSMAWLIQVTTTLLIGESVIALAALPILAWITVSDSSLSYFCLSLLVLWELLFVSYVFKRVLSINTLASAVVGIFYFIITYVGVFVLNVVLAL